jgi:hypothetical protein
VTFAWEIFGVISDRPEIVDEIEQLLQAIEVRHADADSAEPTAAWPAARRAVSTRNGEQLT